MMPTAQPSTNSAVRLGETRVAVRRTRLAQRLSTGAMFAFVSAATALGAWAFTWRGPWFGVGGALLALAGVLGAVSSSLARRTTDPGGIEVDADAVTLSRWSRRLRYPLADVKSGWLASSPTGIDVEFTLQNGTTVCAQVPDVATGHRLLDAARLDTAQRTCTTRLGRSSVSIASAAYLLALVPAAIITAIVAPSPPGAGRGPFAMQIAIWLALVSAASLVSVLAFASQELTIGADGLTLRRVGTAQFVPFADVASVVLEVPDVKLTLRNGATVVVPTSRVSGFERDAIYGRIGDALRAWSRDGGRAGLDALDRQGRTLAAWRGALAALVGHGENYRRFALTREDLLRALEDASTSVERRLGAALALTAQRDPEAVARVRLVAGATANERVRVALDSVAQGAGDESVIEQAISATDGAEPAAARRRD